MLIGVMSDVHGNRIALDAVVADGMAQGIGEWWVLGDLAAIGPDPISTLEALAALPSVRFVRGNTDRYVVTGERPPPHRDDVARDPELQPLFDAIESSFTWTHATVEGSGWLPWLATLPTEQSAVLRDGTRLLGVHASPDRDDGAGITPTTTDRDLREMFSTIDADVLIAGHTHQAADRRVDGRRAINLGSVSNPITSKLDATYVLLNDDRHGHRLVHRRVAYDHDAVVERLRHSSHPQAEYIASFQRGAQVRHSAERPGSPKYAT